MEQKKCCATCKTHKNKPSRCTLVKDRDIFTPRKDTCGYWSPKK